jgi:hypothetical protein
LKKRKITLRELITVSQACLDICFGQIVKENAKAIHGSSEWKFEIGSSSEAFKALCLEIGFIYLLCFLDSTTIVFGGTSWVDFFSKFIADYACDSLRRRYSMDNAEAIRESFLERLKAFAESQKLMNTRYSNWSTTYSRVSARRLEPFVHDDELPAWLALSTFYGIALCHSNNLFNFLFECEVSLNNEDIKMLSDATDGQK